MTWRNAPVPAALGLIGLLVAMQASPSAERVRLQQTLWPYWQMTVPQVEPAEAPAIVPPTIDLARPVEVIPELTPPTAKAELPKAVASRPKPKPRDDDDRPMRKKQPAPQTENCFFPISCATVCSYARAGSSQRGTACQNRLGMACIRSTCPDVLRRR